MELNDYQAQAKATNKGTRIGGDPIVYPALKLAGEAGEVAEKIAKLYRDGLGVYTPEAVDSIVAEIGDCLWYIAIIADELGVKLDTVAAGNLDKLADRAERGVIGGSGDNR